MHQQERGHPNAQRPSFLRTSVGDAVVGRTVGVLVGRTLGATVGRRVGNVVGTPVGRTEGLWICTCLKKKDERLNV